MMTESLVRVSTDPVVDLFTARTTTAPGPALLVVHGGPDWDHTYLTEPLARLPRQVVFADLRGCGRSTRGLPDGAYTPDAATRDLVALLDALKIGEVDVLGFSYGGLIAQRLALARPVRRLAIASSSVLPVSTPDGRPRAERAAAMIPSATAVVLEEAGHMAHVDQPEAWLRAVAAFLGGKPG
ncbi:alpha/beta hydrolase fold [Nonomuraea solani]|uniref:Alpha/beta hydrolase fold n=1 Tax=Nonomuraea solani TaxID=1144553 RepID=A0A1H6E2M0_9ACTN|nr:alpha/beta fold hydrolase [Nonomuraea solani]SEG91958.1 alpha/beta hydrolase fold [Nonomuraea solani]